MGAGDEVEALVEQDSVARLATVRLGFAGGEQGPVLDLLFASSGIESELVKDADPIARPIATIRDVAEGMVVILEL